MKLEHINIAMIQKDQAMGFVPFGGKTLSNDEEFCYQEDTLLLFMNIGKEGKSELVLNCFLKNMCDNISDYLFLCFTQIMEYVGEYAAKLIMMESINDYLDKRKRKNKDVSKICEELGDRFNALCNMAAFYAQELTRDGYQDSFLSKSLYSPVFKEEMEPYLSETEGFPPYTVLALLLEHSWLVGNGIEYRAVPGLKDGKVFFLDIYVMKGAFDALSFELVQALKTGRIFKCCQNCGKYFTPTSRSDEIYCDNVFRNGKTCKQLGYYNKVEADEILRTYRTIYKTQNARKQRNKKNVGSVDSRFEMWTRNAKEMLRLCQTGVISLDEMKTNISGDAWLKEGDSNGEH